MTETTITNATPCENCAHGAYFHRLDDARNVPPTDPDAKFRCVWLMPDRGPRQCDCPDFITPVGVTEN